MKKILSLVTLLLLTMSAYAHVWEIRVNQAQNGTLTWYLQSYHTVGQCGIANSGLTINGVNYPLLSEHSGTITGLSNTIFATTSYQQSRASYAIVQTPFLGTNLNVQPYSTNQCWAFMVGGSGSFTPPPPPVCTTCPITSWTNTNGAPNNNGTACNVTDDYLPTTVTVNHLSCASITGNGQFNVIYDPSGANVSYGPYNYTTGISTDVTINLPYGVTSNTQLSVASAYPCTITHGLTVPGGVFNGVVETVPPVIACPVNITVNADATKCGAVVNYSLPTATDNCAIANIAGSTTISYTGSIENFTVPAGVNVVTITAKGAQGGGNANYGGLGASMTGTFNVTPNQSLKVLVGQKGYFTSSRAGGGGGTFVTDMSNNPLVIAGGGGGAGNCGGNVQGLPGVTSTSGTSFNNVMAGGVGTNGGGGGGGVSGSGGGGAGFYGNGGAGSHNAYYCTGGGAGGNGTDGADGNCGIVSAPGGLSFLNGGAGGVVSNGANGGFGGGGSAYAWNCSGGGGGGYSGGGGGGLDLNVNTAYHQVGGGGGSYNAGTNQTNIAGTQSGNGEVTISWNISYLAQIEGLAPGAEFPVGTTTNKFVATDRSGNTDTCSFTVTVTDNENPTITAPAAVTVNADNGTCAATNVTLGTPTTADNCGVAGTVNNALSSYPVGTTAVTWTVTDIHGNSATATQNVIVIDNQNPTITAPADVAVTADNGICAANNVNLGTPATADNCGVASTANDGTTYPVGTTVVTWTVTDIHGNTAMATQNVIVTDNERPTITAPADVTITADNGICAATNVNLGTPTTADNCGVAGTTNDGTTYPVGTTVVTWTVTDIHGNSATATQNVIVTDNELPTITAPADVTVNADNGVCAATNVSLGTPTTGDNCGVAGTSNDGTASYNVGTTVVTWTVTDIHGNSATATQNVVVVDNQNPTITAPADVTVNADNGACAATNVNLGTPTTADNCGVAGTTNNGTTSYPVGTTVVTWTVNDVNGNSATATQNVIVVDNQNPITVCKSYTLNLSGGTGTVTPQDVDNGSSDNCGIASMSVSPNTFTCADAGTQTVTLTVTDIHGNSSSCNATVTVQYQPTCTITTTAANNTYTGGNPNNIYLGYGSQSATVSCNATGGTGFTYSWSPATDLSCTNCQSPVFTPSAAGNYTYTVTATNSNGCATTCTVSFCVLDVQVPGKNGKSSGKVYLCHSPNGNPNNSHTLSISVNAVSSHLGNHSGDRLGTCDQSCGSSAKGGKTEVVSEEEEATFGNTAVTIGELKVYPNPNNGKFIIELPEEVKGGQANILDMSGRVIRTVNFNTNAKIEITLGDVSNGVYMVQVLNNGNVYRSMVSVKN